MDLPKFEERLERLEENVNRIMARLGIPEKGHSDLNDQVVELLARGQKIEAIKIWRVATGAGLKQAKDAVEKIEAGRRGGNESWDRIDNSF